MNVYAEVLPHTLGRVMHRINRELKRHAPPEVRFVQSPQEAQLQVLDVLGTGSPPYLTCAEYAILQHCYNTTETRDQAYWLPLFRRARLVMSYHDLYALTGADDFPFYHAPWGVDGTVFCDHGLGRRYAILTSGYDLNQEAIGECHEALFTVLGGQRGGMIHLGPAFWQHAGFEAYTGITDEELAGVYSRCHYVAGLRRGEGFELPVLEGLACGARPICFDTPGYRYWFGDHAVYVAERPAEELTQELAEVFRQDPDPVTAAEREIVLARFDWAAIFGGLWRRVLAHPAPANA